MFTRTERLLIAFVLLFLLSGAVIRAVRPVPRTETRHETATFLPPPLPVATPDSMADDKKGLKTAHEKININKAGVREITRLRGIGEKTALRIIEYRQAHGPFRTLDDLNRIKGIGPKKLSAIAPDLEL